MKKIIYSVLVCAAAVGCSSNPVDEVPVSRPREIQISSGVEASAVSKAAVSGTTNDLSNITVLQLNGGTTAPTSFSGAMSFVGARLKGAPMPITFPVGSAGVEPKPYPVYALDNKSAYLKAYHPGVGTPGAVLAGEVMTWTIDGKTDILISKGVYGAGSYTTPLTPGMIFEHQLAQLEVVCTVESEANLAATIDTWGTITSIELKNTPSKYLYTYASSDPGVTATTPMNIPLVEPDYETAFATQSLAVSTSVMAAGMFAPAITGTAPLTLLVKTSKVTAGVDVVVQLKALDEDKGFEVGKKHTVTLTFKAEEKKIAVSSTSIKDWDPGYAGAGTVENP